MSAYHRKNQYTFLALAAVALLIFGVSNSFAQEAESIVLTTDKESYLPGDTVQLSGVVTGQQPSVGVALEVMDSDGTAILFRTIQADQNGNFAVQFKIPATATSGAFSVYASALIDGFHVKQTKVFSATVPEFGQTAGQVFGLAVLSTILVFTASGRLHKITTQDLMSLHL
ncbi:MAG: MG2 domain-containing protein [Nitrosotalea sp.]